MNRSRLLLRRLKNRDRDLTELNSRTTMATSKKSGLSCAKSTQCVKLEGVRPEITGHGGANRWDNKSRSGVCLTGPNSVPFSNDVKGADVVDFRGEERMARGHYVGFAGYDPAPLAAFVSPQGYSGVPAGP